MGTGFRRSNRAFPVLFWDWLATRARAMCTDKPPFSDARVRQALSLGLDRRKWVAQYLDGEGSSWAPRVRNYGPKNSFDRGAQLEVVWVDRV